MHSCLVGLSGAQQGISESRYVLPLIASLFNLPDYSSVLISNSVDAALLALFMHPNANSQLQIAVLDCFHSMIAHPSLAERFLDFDIRQALDSLSFAKRKSKDRKEEPFLNTSYKVLLSYATDKRSLKLQHHLRSLLNKSAVFSMLRNLKLCIQKKDCSNTSLILSSIETLRKNLKLLMLPSSSRANFSLKHDIQSSLLLNSHRSMNSLCSYSKMMSCSVLPRYLADWFDSTCLLENLLACLSDGSRREDDFSDFRSLFIAVSDILLSILKSRGGIYYLTSKKETVLQLIQYFSKLRILDCEEAWDCSLLEEENLSVCIQLERLPSYSRQIGFLLKAMLKLAEILEDIMNKSGGNYVATLYGFLNAIDDQHSGLTMQLFYQVCRLNTDIFKRLVNMMSLDSADHMIVTFYLLEILSESNIYTALIEDRTGELLLETAQHLQDTIESVFLIKAENEDLPPLSKPESAHKESLLQILSQARVLLNWASTVTECYKKGSILNRLVDNCINNLPADEACICYWNVMTVNSYKVGYEGYGLLTEPNARIIKILASLRVINTMLELNKWMSAKLLARNYVNTVKKIASHVTYLTHSYVLDVINNAVFQTSFKTDRKNHHLELLIPLLNSFNLILEQLLATEIPCFVDTGLLEALINLYCLCEYSLIKERNLTVRKVCKLIGTTFILWCQFPNFCDIYLNLITEHSFSYPYKHSGVLNLLSSILEHYVSYKDPQLYNKVLECFTRAPAPSIYPTSLLYYTLCKTSSTTEQHEIMESLYTTYEKVKESKSSKTAIRQVWEFSKVSAVGGKTDRSVLETLLYKFSIINNREVHAGLVRLLRCVISTQHFTACQIVATHLLKFFHEEGIQPQAKALMMIAELIDLPGIKAILIHNDLADIAIKLLSNKELQCVCLRVLRGLFAFKISLSEESSYRLVEDMPTITQTQNYLLESRKFLSFKLPPGISIEQPGEEEVDTLYDEFVRETVEEREGGPYECTLMVLHTVHYLSQHSLGRVLLLTGQFPLRSDLPPALDMTETLRCITATLKGCDDWAWTAKMLSLVDLAISIFSEVPLAPPEAIDTLIDVLRESRYARARGMAESLKLNQNPDLTTPMLPEPRDLQARFPKLVPDLKKFKEVAKERRKAHMEQLVISERLGERVQVKAVHSLTDLLPPPFKPLFKHKFLSRPEEWYSFSQESIEFLPEILLEKKKETEDKEKKQHRESIARAPAPIDLFTPKAPIASVMPMAPVMPTAPQPMMMAPPPTGMFTDAERMAYQEIQILRQKIDRTNDPRLQQKIEQILNENPNLCNFLKNKIEY